MRRAPEGYHGLIYRSVRSAPQGVCGVLFLDRADALVALEPVGDHEWESFAQQGAS